MRRNEASSAYPFLRPVVGLVAYINHATGGFWNSQPRLRESFVAEDTVVKWKIVETIQLPFFIDK
jgi:hypothetical protein